MPKVDSGFIQLVISIGVIFLSASACSTARPRKPVASQRQGFLDRVGRMEPANQQTKTYAKKSDLRSPGHVAPSPKIAGDFQWPLRFVEVTSPFGRRGREFHEGIDLRASAGTPVYASKAGTVLYADAHIKGYGKMVVIRHKDQTATIYAHNSQVLVRRGEQVKQGQQIALSGSTGHVTGPHVHFEIRRGLSALNPLKFLPRPVRVASLK